MANQREINKLIDAKRNASSRAIHERYQPTIDKLGIEIRELSMVEGNVARDKILKAIDRMSCVSCCTNVPVYMDVMSPYKSSGYIYAKPSKKLVALISKREAWIAEQIKADIENSKKADKVKETITLAGCRADVLVALKKYLG